MCELYIYLAHSMARANVNKSKFLGMNFDAVVVEAGLSRSQEEFTIIQISSG